MKSKGAVQQAMFGVGTEDMLKAQSSERDCLRLGKALVELIQAEESYVQEPGKPEERSLIDAVKAAKRVLRELGMLPAGPQPAEERPA